jgi:hypothetical protein
LEDITCFEQLVVQQSITACRWKLRNVMNGEIYEGGVLGPFEDISWHPPGSTEMSGRNFSENIR